MATLNLSTNGPSISKSYQSVVSSSAPTGAAASSPTYGQWAIYSVSAPLVNAFQPDTGGKESVLKVQSTGEGELVDLIDEFSDGRVQFAFTKVKDSNTTLPKYVLIGWCGEGVPERTKGYFTSYQAAVAKVLHGYHVQITARSDRDLTPEGIVQKVADASGSKYSGDNSLAAGRGPPPPIVSKPAFQPTRSSGGASAFNPLTSSASRVNASQGGPVDEDGWGHDAPPVTRTQLEKVQSAYQPTKVNMRELGSQNQDASRAAVVDDSNPERSDVVRGAYQPVGKVDIAAIRKQAQNAQDDRPTIVKGAYEPVGKVDIAAIRAKAQQPSGFDSTSDRGSPAAPDSSAQSSEETKTLPERSAPFTSSERLTSLPKPRIVNRFGAGNGAGTFTGTKVPSPGLYGSDGVKSPTSPPVGVSKNFADQSGKTPAQLWAEKKARERGLSGSGEQPSAAGQGSVTSPLANQTSGGGEWKSGYSGKSWAPVQIAKAGNSSADLDPPAAEQADEAEDEEPAQMPTGGVGSIRDRFKDVPPISARPIDSERSPSSPPPLETSTKPVTGRGIAIPGLQGLPTLPMQRRSPTPPTPTEDSGSPIQVAAPVSRTAVPEVEDAHEEQMSPPPAMPVRSLAREAAQHQAEASEPELPNTGRGASEALAASSFGHEALQTSHLEGQQPGKRAIAQYDYEKAEENELELREGEHVTNIEMVDADWWMGRNERGEEGLFPSNYVELVEDDHEAAPATMHSAASGAVPPAAPAGGSAHGATATALYDYEAAEDNELSFPEGSKITNVEFPDEDWWSGEHGGHTGLFPANYVQLDD